MGQLSFADDGDMGAGVGDHLAVATVPHHWDLRGIVHRVRVSAELHYWKSVAVGNRAADRADVPAIYFLYDHRSGNFCFHKKGADYRCCPGGIGGVCLTAR